MSVVQDNLERVHNVQHCPMTWSERERESDKYLTLQTTKITKTVPCTIHTNLTTVTTNKAIIYLAGLLAQTL